MNGRIGSLCSGYEGLGMAVQSVLGGELAWVADNDPGAAKILAHRFPGVPNLGDITATGWSAVEPVDILIGGYPCQPSSDAGLRKGAADERHIWPHFVPAIRVLRPRLVVLENVRGHLGRGFDAVLGDLAALGFDAEWVTMPAAGLGACHRRQRVFILAWPAEDPDSATRGEWRIAAAREAEGGRPWADAGRPGGARPAADPAGERREGERRPKPIGSTASPVELAGPHRDADADWRSAEFWSTPGAFGRYEAAVRRHERAFRRWVPAPLEPGRNGDPRLAPKFAEWMMGLPAGWVTDVPGLSRNDQLHAIGNGVMPQQGAAAIRLLLERAPEAMRSLLARTGAQEAA